MATWWLAIDLPRSGSRRSCSGARMEQTMWCSRRPRGRGDRSRRSTERARSGRGSSGSWRTAPRNDRRARGRRAHLEARAAHAGTAQEAVAPEEAAVSEADRQRVVAALNQLDGDDRLVIALRWFEQLTEAEMVETLDVPAGTVKSRLSRAMSRSARGARGGRSGPWLTRSRTPASRRSS